MKLVDFDAQFYKEWTNRSQCEFLDYRSNAIDKPYIHSDKS